MAADICPWWLGYALASPLRRLWLDPRPLLAPWVGEGMLVLEPGPGMGFFTLELARMVGDGGRVVAVDPQPRMIAGLLRRSRRAGLEARVEGRVCRADRLGVGDLAGRVDLVVAFHVVHEVPNHASFFAELRQVLRPGAALLLAEPRGHVTPEAFADELAVAQQAGLGRPEPLRLGRDHAVALR